MKYFRKVSNILCLFCACTWRQFVQKLKFHLPIPTSGANGSWIFTRLEMAVMRVVLLGIRKGKKTVNFRCFLPVFLPRAS
ncbi:MAG TPA: hypothetical protein DCF33_19575 [Saprospirales bacterium]|nr:hypothetical protein [Saprospirales bacterium]